MKTLKYKREWLASEKLSAALKAGVLISWWRTMNGETVLVVRRER